MDRSTPDAVYFTADRKPAGGSSEARLARTVAWLRPILGGRPWISEVDAGYIARLANPDGSLGGKYLPGGGDKYMWVEVEPGVEYGYLMRRSHATV